MKVLKPTEIIVDTSTTMTAVFPISLNTSITKDNISITPVFSNIPTPIIKDAKVDNNEILITCQPLTPFAQYTLTFFSTSSVLFTSLDNTYIVPNDNVNNVLKFYGPINPEDPFKSSFETFFSSNIYDYTRNTTIGKNIEILSTFLSKSVYDIRQSKNENYLSFDISNEQKTRGAGPFDRLNEEGAYEVSKVSRVLDNTNFSGSLVYDEFPSTVISLQETENQEEITLSSTYDKKTLNINDLIITLSKTPVIKLNSLVFTYYSSSTYAYPIETVGYQVKDYKYDGYAFGLLTLEDNQIKLSDKILQDSTFSLENIFKITINYSYKDLGKTIDTSTVSIYSIFTKNREVLASVSNVVNLKNSTIVKSDNSVPTLAGITFIDPNTLESLNTKHPAFKYELVYRLEYLPAKAGEYSVDYSVGTIYVFGEDSKNTGTGMYPPLATYKYRATYIEGLDYVIDTDTYDVVALPNGSLIDQEATISFTYEYGLYNGIDFKANLHKESLQERVKNKLINLGTLQTDYSPITDVFEVFNETSGEKYPVVRWDNSKIYFDYNNAPTTESITDETAKFLTISNEKLIVSEVLTSPYVGKVIFKTQLLNTNVIAASQDSIGYNQNTSVSLSSSDVFINEKYFDFTDDLTNNLLSLTTLGDYLVDYVNGTLYVLVYNTQSLDIGTIQYKTNKIETVNDHILSVEDIFNIINPLDAPQKTYAYTSFDDTTILFDEAVQANENYLLTDPTRYYFNDSSSVGTYNVATFEPGVSNNIKALRGIWEFSDLKNNKYPLNFALFASFTDNLITLGSYTKQEFHVINQDLLSQYYVDLNINLDYISSNINYNIQVIRLSDSQDLWDGTGTITVGAPVRLILPNTFSPASGETVIVILTWSINSASRLIVDYDRGDLKVDYTYLKDEIVISYEYGDNYLDFRESDTLSEGDTYYVSYKAGGLRNALLKNFGSLTTISLLNNIDTSFPREIYRDALSAAFSSAALGTSKSAISNIVEKIVHTPPEILEAALFSWILNQNYLFLSKPATSGTFELQPGKFGNGVLINSDSQSITIPISSNFRLEEGSFETWVVPQWDGIDNDAALEIKILVNNQNILERDVYFGSLEKHYNRTVDKNNNSYFTVSKSDGKGIPNKNKNGVFVYYDLDASQEFYRWFISVNDDGYSSYGVINTYNIEVKTDGEFYDTKLTSSLDGYSLTTGLSKIKYKFTNTNIDESILTFVADKNHYVIDFGEDKTKNRFSLFKDPSGYLNLKVFDKNKMFAQVSSNVSTWKKGEKHFIAASWNLSSPNKRDEIHLFVDGQEVFNNLNYGLKINPYLHQKYKTIGQEEFVGVIPKNIVGGIDLTTSSGSNIVSSLTNFGSAGITAGDIIIIDEPGFNALGYTIITVFGQSLTLSSSMPATLTDGNFTINSTSITTETPVDVYPNFAVALLHSSLTGTLDTSATSNIVTSGVNFILNNVAPGYFIRIDDPTLEKYYTILSVSINSLVLNNTIPINLTGATFYIYPPTEEEISGQRALYPSYSVSNDIDNNSVITIVNNADANDIVLVKTLGLNNQQIKKKSYVWGNTSNIIETTLAPPININTVNIKKNILELTNIGPLNSTLSLGVFTSNNLTTYQPTESVYGRYLSFTIAGTNIDFSTSVQVNIVGDVSETLTFTEMGTLTTASKFKTISYVQVVCKPVNSARNCLTVSGAETNNINVQDDALAEKPVIRYTYQVLFGTNLSSSGNIVTDNDKFFSEALVGSYLRITSPLSSVGYYQILAVSNDHLSMTIDSTLPSFTGGTYEVLMFTPETSGFQNGFIALEKTSQPGQKFLLTEGTYQVDYLTYLSLQFNPLGQNRVYIGTDFNQENNFNGILNQFKTFAQKLRDVRTGETLNAPKLTITKDYNSLKPLKNTNITLTSLTFNEYPFINEADFWVIRDNKRYIQSSYSVNANFDKAICIKNSPLVIDNEGIFNTNEGTIEFWVSPIYGTLNDPNKRYLFDATNLLSETYTSDSVTKIIIKTAASSLESIYLTYDDSFDYSIGATLSSDGKTITLKRRLPNQNSPVIVNYIPTGSNGDRLSIFKDEFGYLNFYVRATDVENKIRTLIPWEQNSWHRIKAQYKFNTSNSRDYMRLFVDGYERVNVYGSYPFGSGITYGSSFIGLKNLSYKSLKFKDKINELYFGSDFSEANKAYAIFDNIKISNVSRPIYSPFGEAIDPNYSSTIASNFPVTEDLYTTYLMDFDKTLEKKHIYDFATIKNKKNGLFDFYLNIFDSFGILASNDKAKMLLETIISSFKPADSRAFITYY